MAGAALSRDAFLAYAGKLAEELVELPGMGAVLCRELTGANRAKVLQVLAPAVQEGGQADLGRYQQMLLQLGLVDPDSPEEDRKPLLDFGQSVKAMELGASKVEALCSTIERLSGLDKRPEKAVASAEGNSEPTASSSISSE